MAWPKGRPRPPTSGRKPGSLNKKSSTIAERLSSSGKDPIQVMIDLLDDPDKELRLHAATQLAPYIYVKRAQHIEVSGKITHEMQQIFEDLIDKSDEELDEIIAADYKQLSSKEDGET